MAIVNNSIFLTLLLASSVFILSEGRVEPTRNLVGGMKFWRQRNAPLYTQASFWCVAIDGRPSANLKSDIDNLCRSGAVDCKPIQAGGNCYQPNNDNFHASYLFNVYYQARKTPAACNFNGDAMLETTMDLSTPTCKFIK